MITALAAAILLHPGGVPSALLKVGPGGAVSLRVRFDILAYTLDETPAETDELSLKRLVESPTADLDQRLKDAEVRFRKALILTTSTGKVPLLTATFPTAATTQKAYKASNHLPLLLPVTASAQLPPGTKTLSIRFPDIVDTVVLTIERPGYPPTSEPIKSSQTSSVFTVRLAG